MCSNTGRKQRITPATEDARQGSPRHVVLSAYLAPCHQEPRTKMHHCARGVQRTVRDWCGPAAHLCLVAHLLELHVLSAFDLASPPTFPRPLVWRAPVCEHSVSQDTVGCMRDPGQQLVCFLKPSAGSNQDFRKAAAWSLREKSSARFRPLASNAKPRRIVG